MPRVTSRTVDDVRRALAPTDELGESPLWPAAALVAAAGLYADLPSQFIAGAGGSAFGVVRWVVPALTVLVLVALGVIRPAGAFARVIEWRPEVMRLTRRRLVLGTIAIVSAANSASIILLIHLLVNGAYTEASTASTLLRAGLHMWVVNVLLFGLWYWQLDGGGRSLGPRAYRPGATSSSRSKPSRRSPRRAGSRSSSTTSTSHSRTQRRSARPTRCR
jgi:hypothetical protein